MGEALHGFEHFTDLGLLLRTHQSEGTDGDRFWVMVMAHEALDASGVHPVGEARIDVGVQDEFDDTLKAGLSMLEGRQLAARLLDAADLAERINRDWQAPR